MYRILLIFLALTFMHTARSQKTNDVIYLMDGSIIRGTISEKNDSTVKIMTCCGSIFAYKTRDVIRISQEKAIKTRVMPKQGYLNVTSLGVLIGSTDDQKSAPFSTIMEHSYRFNKDFAIGGFLGFEQLNENVLPVGFNMKAFLKAGSSDFFFSFLGGYSLSLEDPQEEGMKSASGGILAGVETGLLIPVSAGSALTFSIGYRYNELNYQLTDYWRGDYERNMTFNRFVIRFGISIF